MRHESKGPIHQALHRLPDGAVLSLPDLAHVVMTAVPEATAQEVQHELMVAVQNGMLREHGAGDGECCYEVVPPAERFGTQAATRLPTRR